MDQPPDAPQKDPLVERLLAAVVVLGAACWLCIYPVALVAAGLGVLVLVPQGNELLDATARYDHLAFKIIFHASVASWALAAWYCSRILLQRRFAGRFASRVLESDGRFTVFVRVWLPRLLGALVYAALALYYFLPGADPAQGRVVAILGALYWLCVVYRRVVLTRALAAAARTDRLERPTRVVLAIGLALSFALFGGFLVSDVELARWLGAAPIIMLAFTSWILFGSIVLVLLPKAYGLPSLAIVPLLFALAAGAVDNHEVRQVAAANLAPRAASIQTDALAWLKAQETEFRAARARGDEWFTVYVASAEGGGLRAAYWTANVLGELDNATEGRFSRRLFALSGVSGGSLGAAAFIAEVRHTAPCNAPEGADARSCLRHFLRGDFLSPMVAYFLFPDLMQRFLPFVTIRSFDRARGLERSWEASWFETHPQARSNPFAAAYDELTSSENTLPRLFLNGTKVETGKRVLISPAAFDQDEMPDVHDLFAIGARRWSVPLSAAVHLSARFPYVSPAAKICNDGAEICAAEAVWGRIVDGGYHENSGAQTAANLLRALRRAAQEFEASQPPGRTRIVAQAVMITNDAGSTRVCDPPRDLPATHWFAELLSPPTALWNSRTARGTQARRALADSAAGLRRDPLAKDCAADHMRAGTLEFSLAAAQGSPERPPALGWFLAVGSTSRMDRALCRAEHVQAIALARRDLGLPGDYQCR